MAEPYYVQIGVAKLQTGSPRTIWQPSDKPSDPRKIWQPSVNTALNKPSDPRKIWQPSVNPRKIWQPGVNPRTIWQPSDKPSAADGRRRQLSLQGRCPSRPANYYCYYYYNY